VGKIVGSICFGIADGSGFSGTISLPEPHENAIKETTIDKNIATVGLFKHLDSKIYLCKIVEVPINGSNPPHYSHINRPWLQL